MTPSIFIEGGGQGPRLDAGFRRGWRKFFSSAGIAKINVIRGGGGPNTWDQFQTAGGHGTHLLLVDSETVPVPGRNAWQFLFEKNKWKLAAADKDSAFLMITSMETWLLADDAALREYFGRHFKRNAVPKRPDLESLLPSDALTALRKCSGGKYQKGEVSFQLLAALNPATVEARCPAAKRLLDRLRAFQ